MKTQKKVSKGGSCKTAALLFGMLALGACNEAPEASEIVLIHIVDQTAFNSFQIRVQSEDILELGGVKNQPNNGLEYHLTIVNELSLNPVHSVSLAAEKRTLHNSLERKKQITDFHVDLIGILAGAYQVNDTVFESTNLYLPLRKMLTQYSQDKRQKIILIQSDLLENSALFSLCKTFKKGESTQRIEEEIISQYPLPDLTQFHFILLYQPQKCNNAEFNYAVVFFTALFESKGATVTLKANL